MKLKRLDTKSAYEIPVKCTITDAFTSDQLIGSDGKPMEIYLYGAESEQARNAVREKDRKYGKKKLTEEQVAEFNADFLVAITQGISPNWEGDDGSAIVYTRAVMRELYKDNDGLRLQVIRFTSDVSEYAPPICPKSSKGLSSGSGS